MGANRISELADQIDAALSRVAAGGRYVLGPEVEAFEERFAEYVGVRHCVGVGSGLDALHLALLAMGVGPGDEVLVPATTYIATWLAVTRTGAAVVPVEPDPRTGNIDPGRLAAAVTHRTRAIVPVHLHGCPADMHAIREVARHHHLRVLEDAAQAHGARHHRPARRRARRRGRVELLPLQEPRRAGRRRRGDHRRRAPGRAPALAAQLRLVGALRALRARAQQSPRRDPGGRPLGRSSTTSTHGTRAARAVAAIYLGGWPASPLGLPVVPPGDVHVWHVFAIRTARRDALAAHLRRRRHRHADPLPGAAASAGRVPRPRVPTRATCRSPSRSRARR